MRADVLVIGAGPAGCAAATLLARVGVSVVLADHSAFPRDKVCGDALIPDALAALDRLGLGAVVAARAWPVGRLRIHAPNRSHVDVPGRMACLPRLELDALLHETALAAGVRFLARHRLEGRFEEDGRVCGACLRDTAGRGFRTVRARHVVLATGAAIDPLIRFGVCHRRRASGVAARVYYQVDEALAAELPRLLISFDRRIRPGYGWIFPGPGGVFNLGVGLFDDGRERSAARSIRLLWQAFVTEFSPARWLVTQGWPLTRLAGAPLRTGLAGAELARPGLLVVGEAAGTTYSFSGEGIGKALESGMLAARCILDEAAGRGEAEATYPQRMRSAYAARFAAYGKAQRWLAHPWLCDWLARRARHGSFVRSELAALLDESGDPDKLFSPAGLWRAALH